MEPCFPSCTFLTCCWIFMQFEALDMDHGSEISKFSNFSVTLFLTLVWKFYYQKPNSLTFSDSQWQIKTEVIRQYLVSLKDGILHHLHAVPHVRHSLVLALLLFSTGPTHNKQTDILASCENRQRTDR